MIPVGLNVVQIYISEIIQQTVQAAVCVLKLDSCVTIYLECLLPAELVISLPSLLKDIDQDGWHAQNITYMFIIQIVIFSGS